MSKPKITSITYSEELPKESAIMLYCLVQNKKEATCKLKFMQ